METDAFFQLLLVALCSAMVVMQALIVPKVFELGKPLPSFIRKPALFLYTSIVPALLIYLIGYLAWGVFVEISLNIQLGIIYWPTALLLVMIFPTNFLSLLVLVGRAFDVKIPRVFNLLSTKHAEIIFVLSFIGCSTAGAYAFHIFLSEQGAVTDTPVWSSLLHSYGVSSTILIIWYLIISAAVALSARQIEVFQDNKTQSKPIKKFLTLLESDESVYLEFKSTFQTPTDGMPPPEIIDGKKTYQLGVYKFKSEKEIQKHLQTQALKSICGFLNCKGGDLIIGVKELEDRHKSILDVRRELGFKNADQFERHVQQQIKDRIGLLFASEYIESEFIEHESKLCLHLTITKYTPSKNQIPALLDEKDLYVRSGARTDPIPPGKPFAEFVSARQSQFPDLPKQGASVTNTIARFFAK